MLPRIEKKKDPDVDARALVDALSTAMEPVVKEIGDSIKTLRKQSDLTAKEFNDKALTYAVRRMEEAIRELGKRKPGEAETSEQRVMDGVEGFANKPKTEQVDLLKEILKNDTFTGTILKELLQSVDGHLHKTLEALVGVTIIGNHDRKKAEDRLATFEKDKTTKKKASAAALRARGGKRPSSRFAAKAEGAGAHLLGNLAFDVGLVGLLTMLPNTVKDFVSRFTSAFTVIKTLLNDSWLAPLFKILDRLPIIGMITRKIPFLNAFFFAWDHLMDIVDSYNKGGMWAAVETTLKDLYSFFVGDLVKYAGQFMDYLTKKMFGPGVADKISFSGFAEGISQLFKDLITDNVKALKDLFAGNFSGFAGDVGSMFKDLIQNTVDNFKRLFKMDPNFDLSKFSAEVWDFVKTKFSNVVTSLVGAIEIVPDVVADLKKSVVDKFTSWKDAASGFVTSYLETWKMMWDDAIKSLADSAENTKIWFQNTYNSILDSIWNSIVDTIKSIPGLSRLTDMTSFERHSATVPYVGQNKTQKQEAGIVQQTMALQATTASGPHSRSPTIFQTQNKNSSSVTNYVSPSIKPAGSSSPLKVGQTFAGRTY